MTVDPEAIKLVLEQSTVAKAAELDPKRFFDNSLIREVNRDYGVEVVSGRGESEALWHSRHAGASRAFKLRRCFGSGSRCLSRLAPESTVKSIDFALTY